MTFSSPFDNFTIVWKEENSDVLIQRIFLSDPINKSEHKAHETFKDIDSDTSSVIKALGLKIQNFLNGADIIFDLKLIDFDRCFEIQRKVLLAEYDIPRGWVSTYKRIANKIGITNGARVVGNSLARNPFPIVIPCHRAIKSNGELGGFQGGVEMKRVLLKLEGVKISNNGKVTTNNIYY